jgi:hypothetical protein
VLDHGYGSGYIEDIETNIGVTEMTKAAPRFTIEFPDFDPATMPDIPDTWVDISWHNDSCPSFEAGHGIIVYVDYDDQAMREFKQYARYMVYDTESETLVIESSYWPEILAKVAEA